jgi:hypothetical protein
MAVNRNRPWSDDDLSVMCEMHDAGKSWFLIAAKLKRSVTAIKTHYYRCERPGLVPSATIAETAPAETERA